MSEKLTKVQAETLLRAKENVAGEFYASTRSKGFRGLPSLGLAYGRTHANKAPGALGMLTAEGVKMRAALVEEG